MYEYIKGKKVELDEHMLSASEIATLYSIVTVESKQPHSLMVSAVIREHIRANNMNISEYYYPHSRGCMRVYPVMLWKPIMDKFIYDNDLDINKEQQMVYKVDAENKKFIYMCRKKITSQNRVIDITERRNRNGN